MTRSMTRMAVAGCMALAALGAMAVIDVGSPTAEAAPSVSRLAGTYSSAGWPAPITISDGGRITSSYHSSGSRGSISGRVSADGSYSYTVTDAERSADERENAHWHTSSYSFTGNMALDADGNIVGTIDPDQNRYPNGGSFVWFRQ